MKKLFLLMGGAIFLSTTAFAYRDIDDRLDFLEKEMQEVSSSNPEGTRGATFTTSRPNTVGNNWFATFDVIYWHPKMGGTEYAFTNTASNFDASLDFGTNGQIEFTIRRPDPASGDIKANDFGWDLGLKAGIGYKTPHDNWDVYARYTWFESEESTTLRKDDPSFLFSLKSMASLVANRAKSAVDIDYNNIDLELARSFFISGRFSLRPHIALKTTWLDLKQDVTYTYANFTTSTLFRLPYFSGHDFKVKESCRVFGMGPRAGIDGKLFLGDRFSLLTEVSGSILYGFFKCDHKELWPFLVLNDGEEIGGKRISVSNKFHQFFPFVHMFLGMGWDTYLNNNKQHLSLKAGYEIQYFWRVNQMDQQSQANDYTSASPTIIVGDHPKDLWRIHLEKLAEDLMFYGITGEVRLDF